MGSTLMGGQKSGTPMETRGGTSALADFYQNILKTGGPNALAAMFGRGATESMVNQFGFDPASLGLGDAAAGMIADPTNATAGLFRSMAPFEAQETARQVAGVRGQFGTMGGRFSRNVGAAEALTRGQVSQGFDVNRYNALLQAGGQRANAVLGLMGADTAARGQAFQEQMLPWQMMQQFLMPGAPQQQPGILPGLLQLGGTAAMAALMPPITPFTPGATKMPAVMPHMTMPQFSFPTNWGTTMNVPMR